MAGWNTPARNAAISKRPYDQKTRCVLGHLSPRRRATDVPAADLVQNRSRQIGPRGDSAAKDQVSRVRRSIHTGIFRHLKTVWI
jgi:hypothetical protein